MVCALEHRDGSGPRTFVNRPDHGQRSREASAENVGQHPEGMRGAYGKVDYLFPKYEYDDALPKT